MPQLVTIDEYLVMAGDSLSGNAALTANPDYFNDTALAISDYVIEWTGKAWLTGNYVEEQDCYLDYSTGYARFTVKHTPYISASAGVLLVGSAEVDLTLTYIYSDSRSGVVLVPVGTMAVPNLAKIRLRLSYMAGYTEVPHNVKKAICLLIREWVQSDTDSQEGRPGPLTSFRIGQYSESYGLPKDASEESGSMGLGTALGKRAFSLLARSKDVGVI